MENTKIKTLILISMIALIIIASSITNKIAEEKEKNSFELLEDDLVIQEIIDVDDMLYQHITGKIENKSDNDYEFVQIKFTAYDEIGNKIGNCNGVIKNFNKKAKRKYDALCITDDSIEIYDYSLKEIIGEQ